MTKFLLQHLQQQISAALKKEISIISCREVFGGDINQTFILTTTGTDYFLKCNDTVFPGIFEKENNGLLLLRAHCQLTIPKPFVFGEFENTCYLMMERLLKQSFTEQNWRSLGEGLALLHQQTQPSFGLAEDNYIGTIKQVNTAKNNWADFYAAQRVLPLFATAVNKGFCTINDAKEAEDICSKFSTLFPTEAPALLHGDLWSGNIMALVNGKAAIYDPAVYYGHREMDIAMTLLFGGFAPGFYESYHGVFPLQQGWQNRVDLCQLYPLLVHLNLFGRTYYARVKNVLNRYK